MKGNEEEEKEADMMAGNCVLAMERYMLVRHTSCSKGVLQSLMA